MPEVRKQAAAEQDLIDIWRYTYLQWGAAQADQYLDRFELAVARLRHYPLSGVDCAHIHPEYRRIKVGSHHLYYRVFVDRIDVIRILDARQDARQWLNE